MAQIHDNINEEKYKDKIKTERCFLYQFLKIIYSTLLKILFRPQIIGKENIPPKGALIFAGNHRHAIDPTVVMMSTDRIVHYMAKEELFKGLHGKIFNKIGLIKVYRGKPNYKAIEEAEKILNNGGTIGIFPEGTRNKTQNNLLEFRKGAVRIAKSTNTPILPFAIKGEYKLFRKSIKVEFLKPLKIGEDLEKENTKLMKLVSKKLIEGGKISGSKR